MQGKLRLAAWEGDVIAPRHTEELCEAPKHLVVMRGRMAAAGLTLNTSKVKAKVKPARLWRARFGRRHKCENKLLSTYSKLCKLKH